MVTSASHLSHIIFFEGGVGGTFYQGWAKVRNRPNSFSFISFFSLIHRVELHPWQIHFIKILIQRMMTVHCPSIRDVFNTPSNHIPQTNRYPFAELLVYIRGPSLHFLLCNETNCERRESLIITIRNLGLVLKF